MFFFASAHSAICGDALIVPNVEIEIEIFCFLFFLFFFLDGIDVMYYSKQDSRELHHDTVAEILLWGRSKA